MVPAWQDVWSRGRELHHNENGHTRSLLCTRDVGLGSHFVGVEGVKADVWSFANLKIVIRFSSRCHSVGAPVAPLHAHKQPGHVHFLQ